MRRLRSTWMTVALGMAVAHAVFPVVRAEEPRRGEASSSPSSVVCPICLRADNQQAAYGEKAGGTLARGATNTIFGWTELIRQPAKEVEGGHTTRNVLIGIAKGAGQGLRRTAGGLAELLTFWTPKMQDGHYLRFSEDCPLCMGRREAASSPRR